jgi:hypothetical protein
VFEDSHYNIQNKDNLEVTIGIVDINSQLYKMNLQVVNELWDQRLTHLNY